MGFSGSKIRFFLVLLIGTMLMPSLAVKNLQLARADTSPPEKQIGKPIVLQSKSSQTVGISKKDDAWNDSDLFVHIPNGTDAEVIGFKKFRLANGEDLIRYQVKVSYLGKIDIGWVHSEDVKERAKSQGVSKKQVAQHHLPSEDCETLVARYGTHPVASIAYRHRQGLITVEVNGHLVEKMGGQDPQFITPRSVCADLEKSGIPLKEIPEQIHLHQQMVEQAAQQKAERERRQAEAAAAEARQKAKHTAEEQHRHAALESGPEKTNCQDQIAAFVMSQQFMKDRLKAPTTAKFPWFSNGHTRYLGQCRHQVNSYVDAQNSFGAIIRTHYTDTLRYTGQGKWTLEQLQIQ